MDTYVVYLFTQTNHCLLSSSVNSFCFYIQTTYSSLSSAGYTDDVCKYLRDSVPKTMLADLKEFVSNGGSVNTKDKYGASVVSNNSFTNL